MRKLPDCDTCLFNARSPYMVCTIHPQGVTGNSCLDYRRDQTIKREVWAPEGYTFYGNELIPNTPSRLSQSDRLELLETHPLFTGRCPQCGESFTEAPNVHWDCPQCDWKDDSVV